jgi:hypothetical protein
MAFKIPIPGLGTVDERRWRTRVLAALLRSQSSWSAIVNDQVRFKAKQIGTHETRLLYPW